MASTQPYPTTHYWLLLLAAATMKPSHEPRILCSPYIEYAVLDVLISSLLLVEWILFVSIEQGGGRYYQRHHATHMSSL